MMTRRDIDNRLQIEFNSVDALVPEDHLIRKIDAALDFNFIYDEVAELYSAFGAPSIRVSSFNKNCYDSVFVWNTFNETNYKRN